MVVPINATELVQEWTNISSCCSGNWSDEDLDGNDTFGPGRERPYQSSLSVEIQIALYSIIFLLAIVGNGLVIVTLIQNKRMRTVTNVFLLNLAVSDLLLTVVCMPFTLVPMLLKNFIFGAAMCFIIRYLQAVAVGASCFTLVAISLERYYAICQPLHSRSWQTLSHSYRSIAVCWLLSAILMTPTVVFLKHYSILKGRAHVCREVWPSPDLEKAYMVLLDLGFLIVPIVVMSVNYGRVIANLASDVRTTDNPPTLENGGIPPTYVLPNYRTLQLRLMSRDSSSSMSSQCSTDEGTKTPPLALRSRRIHRIRHTNPERIRQNKIRVIRMLFVIVIEFFISWTPVYVINTWMIFDMKSASGHLTPLAKSLVHLLSYLSSFCNPITYCFMNKKFREAFVRAFRCKPAPPPLKERRRMHVLANGSRRSDRFNPMSSTSTMTSSVRQLEYDQIHGHDDSDS